MVDWNKPIKCRNGAPAEFVQQLGNVVLITLGKGKAHTLVYSNGCFNEDGSPDDCDIVNDNFPATGIVALHKVKSTGQFFVTGPYNETDIIRPIGDSEIVALAHAEFEDV